MSPVLITVDVEGGQIHCHPAQAPADLITYAIDLAVSAIYASVIDEPDPEVIIVETLAWVEETMMTNLSHALAEGEPA